MNHGKTHDTMTSELIGRWTLQMRTPVGSLAAELTFTEKSGSVTGRAEGLNETVELHNIRAVTGTNGEQVSWRQSITKPLRLDLDFDVVIDGDQMRGHSRAGRLPRTTVIGHRINDEEPECGHHPFGP
jgi:hypothetical protein